MSEFLSFVTSVMAKVAAYYICKWLDKMSDGNKPALKWNRKPQVFAALGVFACSETMSVSILLPTAIIAYAFLICKILCKTNSKLTLNLSV